MAVLLRGRRPQDSVFRQRLALDFSDEELLNE